MALPALTLGGEGRLLLGDCGVERGRAAARRSGGRGGAAGGPPLGGDARVPGGRAPAQAPTIAGPPGLARLSLAALVADPGTALAAFAAQVVGDEDALRTLLEALASLLGRVGLGG